MKKLTIIFAAFLLISLCQSVSAEQEINITSSGTSISENAENIEIIGLPERIPSSDQSKTSPQTSDAAGILCLVFSALSIVEISLLKRKK